MLLQVFQRLQKLNICMSHQVTSSLVTAVGTDFDANVYQWKLDGLYELEQAGESEVGDVGEK